jgi:hypothetical protein
MFHCSEKYILTVKIHKMIIRIFFYICFPVFHLLFYYNFLLCNIYAVSLYYVFLYIICTCKICLFCVLITVKVNILRHKKFASVQKRLFACGNICESMKIANINYLLIIFYYLLLLLSLLSKLPDWVLLICLINDQSFTKYMYVIFTKTILVGLHEEIRHHFMYDIYYMYIILLYNKIIKISIPFFSIFILVET